jgi:hypothetical protein
VKTCQVFIGCASSTLENMGLKHFYLDEEDYAIIFSSTFDSMPHKNRNGWGYHATDRRNAVPCAAQQDAVRVSTSWAFSSMSKTITFPFKIPLSRDAIKHLANFFNVQIVEKVATPSPHPKKISDTSYFHTIPLQTIDKWDSTRHDEDSVEAFRNSVGFHLKRHGRSGTIYYVDNSSKVCECYYELSGVANYDILVAENQLSEWFLPAREKLSSVEKEKIITEMKSWLANSNIRASFY